MRQIKITFSDSEMLSQMLQTDWVRDTIAYLEPERLTPTDLVLNDPQLGHSYLDTEVVVLTMLATAIKKLFFRDTPYPIAYQNQFANEPKGGLIHHKQALVTSTDVRQASS